MNIYKKIKSNLASYPQLVKWKQGIWRKCFDYSRINICNEFPLYRPNSASPYDVRATIATQTINQIFPNLRGFADSAGLRTAEVKKIETAPCNPQELDATAALKELLDSYGSDKSTDHNYHFLYGAILCKRLEIKSLLEIGMGTNNPDFISNMGTHGRPGASLRAFRDFLPNAKIYGADLDKGILFQEDRISSYFVDQTDLAAFEELQNSVPHDLDLIIDDGLHSPNANIITMTFAMNRLKLGGWFVVEDISMEALPFWQLVAALVPKNYNVHIYRASRSLVFAIQRL